MSYKRVFKVNGGNLVDKIFPDQLKYGRKNLVQTVFSRAFLVDLMSES